MYVRMCSPIGDIPFKIGSHSANGSWPIFHSTWRPSVSGASRVMTSSTNEFNPVTLTASPCLPRRASFNISSTIWPILWAASTMLVKRRGRQLQQDV